MTQKEQIEKEIADRQSWLEMIESSHNGGQLQCQEISGKWADVLCKNDWIRFGELTHRIKPKPRECWRVEYADGELGDRCYESSASALLWVSKPAGKSIKFVEVLE